MIVKNEENNIVETLDKFSPFADAWCICDTGSTDNTAKVVTEYFANKGMPGSLKRHEWEDFGTNRTKAFRCASKLGDWVWMIDADDLLEGEPDWSVLDPEEPGYAFNFTNEDRNILYTRPLLLNSNKPWVYKQRCHEYAHLEGLDRGLHTVPGALVICRHIGGGVNVQDRFKRNVELLKLDYEEDPENTRCLFYLGNEHFTHGKYEEARDWYEKRVRAGGWEEEVYHSLYQRAVSGDKLDLPAPLVKEELCMAWEYRPTRGEALTYLARYCRMRGEYQQAYVYSKHAAHMPLPENDVLFVEKDIYMWQAALEFALNSLHTGRKDEAKAMLYPLYQLVPEYKKQDIIKLLKEQT
jgi:glycosyltransferase involved in cell wall biosynthesis